MADDGTGMWDDGSGTDDTDFWASGGYDGGSSSSDSSDSSGGTSIGQIFDDAAKSGAFNSLFNAAGNIFGNKNASAAPYGTDQYGAPLPPPTTPVSGSIIMWVVVIGIGVAGLFFLSRGLKPKKA